MSNWEKCKKVPSMAGVTDLVIIDGSLKSFIISGVDGPVLVSFRDYNGIEFFMAPKPKTVQRWKASGCVGKAKIETTYYEDKYEAESALDHADGIVYEKVDVYLDVDGNVTGEVVK